MAKTQTSTMALGLINRGTLFFEMLLYYKLFLLICLSFGGLNRDVDSPIPLDVRSSDNLFVSGSYSEQYGKGIRLSISLYLILYIWLVEI